DHRTWRQSTTRRAETGTGSAAQPGQGRFVPGGRHVTSRRSREPRSRRPAVLSDRREDVRRGADAGNDHGSRVCQGVRLRAARLRRVMGALRHRAPLAVATVLVLVASGWWSFRSSALGAENLRIGARAPEITGGPWIGSAPLTLAALRG